MGEPEKREGELCVLCRLVSLNEGLLKPKRRKGPVGAAAGQSPLRRVSVAELPLIEFGPAMGHSFSAPFSCRLSKEWRISIASK